MKILKDALTLIWILMKWFPKFFAPLGNLIPVYGQLMVYLPEVISLLKWTKGQIEKGYTEKQIKDALKGIDNAFKEDDAKVKAKKLNDIFNS